MGHFARFDKLTTHKLRLHYVSSGQAGMECWIGGTPNMSLLGACDVVIWIDLASALINEIAALHFIPLAMTSLKNIAWQAVTRNDKVYISEL